MCSEIVKLRRNAGMWAAIGPANQLKTSSVATNVMLERWVTFCSRVSQEWDRPGFLGHVVKRGIQQASAQTPGEEPAGRKRKGRGGERRKEDVQVYTKAFKV